MPEAVDVRHFDDHGEVTEHWGVVNQLDLLHQLGAVPAERV